MQCVQVPPIVTAWTATYDVPFPKAGQTSWTTTTAMSRCPTRTLVTLIFHHASGRPHRDRRVRWQVEPQFQEEGGANAIETCSHSGSGMDGDAAVVSLSPSMIRLPSPLF